MITLSTILRLCLIVTVAGCSAEAFQQPPAAGTRGPISADPSGSGTIEGVVVLPSGEQVTEAIKITLSTLSDPGLGLFTDSNGRFSFPNLAPGTYYLEATGDASAYDPGTEQVRLARGVRVMRVRLYLREKAGAAVNKKPGGVVSANEIDQKAPDSAKKEFETASRLANEGNPTEAIERYKKAIAIYPKYLMAHNDLGVQYLNLKRLADATTEFETCIEIDAKAFNPRLNQGIVLVQQKKYGEALEQLRLADSIDSSSAAVHLYLGIVAVETDELATAENELAKALSMGGRDYSITHFYIANVHLKKGEREGAIRELDAFLSTSPDGEEAARARRILDTLKRQKND